jgi:hypothetical protein
VLQELLKKKKNGLPIGKRNSAVERQCYHRMDALKASLKMAGITEQAV